MTVANLLDGVTVIELGERVSTGYCGRLLADAGAQVVRIENHDAPADPATAAYRDYLHRGKRVVAVAADSRELHTVLAELAADAAILVCDDDHLLVRPGQPGLGLGGSRPVTVSMSDYGLDGPSARTPASDFTLQAEAGLTILHPAGSRPPVATSVELTEVISGVAAAFGALIGLLGIQADPREAVGVDVSRFEALAAVLQYPWLFGRIDDHVPYPIPQNSVPGVERAADGWVSIVAITPPQWAAFKQMAGVPELDDDRFNTYGHRVRLGAEVTPLIRRFTEKHTVAELVDMAVARRLPAAPVATPETVAKLAPYAERHTYPPRHWFGGSYRHPGPPFRVHQVGTGVVAREGDSAPPVGAGGDARQPLRGIRVVEFGAFQAGPIATSHLAGLGAEVIKVEAVARPDMLRFTGTEPTVRRAWERAAPFLGANLGKRAVTLDLSEPESLDLARRLIATADVVVENYTPRVLEEYQLDYDGMRQLSPEVIVVRMPAWGLSGTWRDRPGVTYTAEAAAGLTAMSGYPDGEPVLTATIVDPIAAMVAAYATLAALWHRRSTGGGACVEVSLCDVAAQLTARPVIESSATGQPQTRRGNRGLSTAPQGVYRCADEAWIALSVLTDQHWSALCAVLKKPQWIVDARFASAEARSRHHDELDREISWWCAELTGSNAVAVLRAAGIPAAPIATGAELIEHPQLVHRGRVFRLEHPVAGTLPYLGLPMRLSHHPQAWMPCAAPLFGQDNHAVLGGLGCDQDRIEKLAEAGLIGNAPWGLPVRR
jgi:crotonobetainyl-CoA:carnitine CoA-transferase CaiB-like acyl-CoA transferase